MMAMSQARFNQMMNAIVAGVMGGVAGLVVLVADAGPWFAVTVAAAWTAQVGFAINKDDA